MTEIVKEIETDEVEGTVLGQRVAAPTRYTPEILVAVPRSKNRDKYSIDSDTFVDGYDSWYCYECSLLTKKGQPVYFAMVIQYPHTSESIVESKSLKLYLNSFNMEPLGDNIDEAKIEYLVRVRDDLNKLLKTSVTVYEVDDYHSSLTDDFKYYDDISQSYDEENGPLTVFTEDPHLLKFNPKDVYIEYNVYQYKFIGFRSNCLITHQPDYGTVYINYKGSKNIDLDSLYRYLTSFRNQQHFHEECCELIYTRIMDKYQPDILSVLCNYTRRGGIDINPFRSSYPSKRITNRTFYQ